MDVLRNLPQDQHADYLAMLNDTKTRAKGITAKAVALEVKKAGYKQKVGVFGYADTRFEDISYNLASHKRMEMARRVDVVIRNTAQGGKQ